MAEICLRSSISQGKVRNSGITLGYDSIRSLATSICSSVSLRDRTQLQIGGWINDNEQSRTSLDTKVS
jgi:hypothetical protein